MECAPKAYFGATDWPQGAFQPGIHATMTPMTMVFGREKSFRLGESSFPIHEDFSLGLKNRTKYTYDANGNLVKQVAINGSSEIDYQYDYRNRLTEVTNKDGTGETAQTTQVVDYSYDAFNRLTTRTVTLYSGGVAGTPVTGHFVYDGDNMVLMLDDSGAVTDRVLYGPAVDQVLAEEDSTGTVTWLLGDNQNTVRDLAQFNSGQTQIVNHRVFSAFGQLLSETDPGTGDAVTVHSVFGYTGCYYDTATKLQWNLNRWYNPALQRWMSQDPIGYLGGINLYRYCKNSPLVYTDPLGLCTAGQCEIQIGKVSVTGVRLVIYNIGGGSITASLIPDGIGALQNVALKMLLVLLQEQVGLSGLGKVLYGELFGINIANSIFLDHADCYMTFSASVKYRKCVHDTERSFFYYCWLVPYEVETTHWTDWSESTVTTEVLAGSVNFRDRDRGGLQSTDPIEVTWARNRLREEILRNLRDPSWVEKNINAAIRAKLGCDSK
jgi:RHS repeat-associated protein